MIINGLDSDEFPPALLVDFDGTVFAEGTNDFLPFAVSGLKQYLALGWRIYPFTCGYSYVRARLLKEVGITLQAPIPKPLACRYGLIDDRFSWGTTTFNATEAGPIFFPGWASCSHHS